MSGVASPEARRPILYASAVDVSASNGPGVNEREFTQALQRRFGAAAAFVLPVPAHGDIAHGDARLFLFRAFRSRALYLVNQLRLLRELRRVVDALDPALVVMRGGQLPLGLALFARRSRVPIALKTQGDPTMKYLCDKPGFKGWFSRRMRTVNLWAARVLAGRAVTVDCCTPQLLGLNVDALAGIDPGKYLVIDNATNVDRFRPQSIRDCRASLGLPVDARIIGYVGGAPWERGGTQLIHAVARLRDRHPGLMAVMVGGSGPGLDTLRGLARELGVADACRVQGQVPYDTVPTWINSFDLGTAMDLPGRGDHVGSSNQKIRQYLACGKPVVANAGVNDFLDEHGLGSTVAVDDVDGFVALVDAWLSRSPAELAAHAAKARRYAEENLSIEAALEARLARWRALGLELPP